MIYIIKRTHNLAQASGGVVEQCSFQPLQPPQDSLDREGGVLRRMKQLQHTPSFPM
jgi:hypothetical protein